MSQDDAAAAAYQDAIKNRTPRYFHASGDNAHGQTGYKDTEAFAENLMVLQECALLLGEKLEMTAVSHAFLYDGAETAGFKYDQTSNPAQPRVVGAIQNRRVPMKEFSEGLDGQMGT